MMAINAQTLREIRQAAGFTQDRLAEAAQTTRRTISRAELGYHKPMPATRKRLAAVLGIELETILWPVDKAGSGT